MEILKSMYWRNYTFSLKLLQTIDMWHINLNVCLLFKMSYLVVKFLDDNTLAIGLRKWLVKGTSEKMYWSSQITSQKRLDKMVKNGESVSTQSPVYDVEILATFSKLALW